MICSCRVQSALSCQRICQDWCKIKDRRYEPKTTVKYSFSLLGLPSFFCIVLVFFFYFFCEFEFRTKSFGSEFFSLTFALWSRTDPTEIVFGSSFWDSALTSGSGFVKTTYLPVSSLFFCFTSWPRRNHPVPRDLMALCGRKVE